MKKMGSKGLKGLRLAHVTAGSVCLGALTAMVALVAWQGADAADTVGFLNVWVFHNSIRALLIMGVIYGVFTKWGFVKHRWVAFKWVLTAGLMVVSSLLLDLGPGLGCAELALLLVIFWLSVYKPGRSTRRGKGATA